MPYFTSLHLLAVVDWWDIGVKALAALCVFGGPSFVIWYTRRGNRNDRNTLERTEVEKLYIDGTANLLRHQRDQIMTQAAEIATLRGKLRAAQEEVDVSNRSFTTYQHNYDRLVALLNKSGIEVPPECAAPGSKS